MYSNLNDSINQLRLFFNNDLTSLSVPELTHIDTPTNSPSPNWVGLVVTNSNLNTISFPNLEQSPYKIAPENLTSIDLSSLKLTEISQTPYFNYLSEYPLKFLHNTKLRSLNLPNFRGAVRPYPINASENFDEYGTDSQASFWNNYWLEEVSLGNSNLTYASDRYYNGYWFRNNYFLRALILRYPYVIPISPNRIAGFFTTPISAGNGYIYVPDELVTSYIAADTWTAFSTKFRPISELPEHPSYEDTITDSWATIINNCNQGQISQYNIGDTKTLTINNMPTQMVIVGKEHDDLANGTGKAKLSWMEKTISRFSPISLAGDYTSAYRQFANADTAIAILTDLYNNIDDTVLKGENGIKLVKKYGYGYESDSPKYISNDCYLWLPAAKEYNNGLRGNLDNAPAPYAYFNNTAPNYCLGATTLNTVNNKTITIALREFSNNSGNYLDVLQAGQLVSNNSDNPYIIFGFCT